MPEPAICAVLLDEHNIHWLTEDQLDTWWASQSPEQKADLFEREMDVDYDCFDSPEVPDAHA